MVKVKNDSFIRELILQEVDGGFDSQEEMEEEINKQCKTIVDGFTKMFPQTDMEVLKSIDDWFEGTVFILEGRVVRFFKDDEDSPWVEAEKIELSTKKTVKKALVYDIAIEIQPNSDENIEYELYPFEQGAEFSASSLGYNLTPHNSQEFEQSDEIKDNILETTFSLGDISLKIACVDNGTKYTLMNGDRIISGFMDPSHSFQQGDAASHCYLHDGKIILENGGDVSSLVIIHGVMDC